MLMCTTSYLSINLGEDLGTTDSDFLKSSITFLFRQFLCDHSSAQNCGKLQSGAKKILACLNFPAFLLPTKPRAADVQPISPDGTCVTELSKVFLLDVVWKSFVNGP